MSSTNRSKKRSEHKEDYYVTPHWCAREFCNAWDGWTEFLTKPYYTDSPDTPLKILDPCAGGDASGNPMTYPTVLKEWGHEVTSMDIREDSLADIKGNYLETDLTGLDFDLIITNPPFNLAVEIITKALTEVRPMGYVVMLLRINFLGSQMRGPWFRDHMPTQIWSHSKRPIFYPDNWKEIMPWLEKKGSDSTEYAHFVWQAGRNPEFYDGHIIEHIRGVSDRPGHCGVQG